MIKLGHEYVVLVRIHKHDLPDIVHHAALALLRSHVVHMHVIRLDFWSLTSMA